MKRVFQRITPLMVWAMFVSLAFASHVNLDSRTTEFPFKLSGDLHSEFRAKALVISAGIIAIEAKWTPLNESSPAPGRPSLLTLILFRPDGAEAARKRGLSPLKLEYRITENEVDIFSATDKSTWSVKLDNDGDQDRSEAEGSLRITVPLSTRVLVDTQFTLLAAGNAQEVPFSVHAPGRLVMEANWQTDPLSGTSPLPTHLTLQLIHTGQDRIYARRRSSNTLRIEQQVTEQEIDKGLRWIARIQNDGQVKVKGLLKVTFIPSL